MSISNNSRTGVTVKHGCSGVMKILFECHLLPKLEKHSLVAHVTLKHLWSFSCSIAEYAARGWFWCSLFDRGAGRPNLPAGLLRPIQAHQARSTKGEGITCGSVDRKPLVDVRLHLSIAPQCWLAIGRASIYRPEFFRHLTGHFRVKMSVWHWTGRQRSKVKYLPLVEANDWSGLTVRSTSGIRPDARLDNASTPFLTLSQLCPLVCISPVYANHSRRRWPEQRKVRQCDGRSIRAIR